MLRKDWDTYFLDIAFMAATRSRCPRRQVGAVLVKHKKLLGSAYNGAPMGAPDCAEAGCMIAEQFELVPRDGQWQKKQRCIRTIHAEQNLLLFTHAHDREGATVYVTDQPCWICANMLANSGVREIVYHRTYPKDEGKVVSLMQQMQITLRCMPAYVPPVGTV